MALPALFGASCFVFAVEVSKGPASLRKGCDFNDQGSEGHVMTPIRTWHWLVAALLVAGVALPATAAKPQQAPDKSYGVEFLLPPTTLDGTTLNPSYTTADGQTTLNLPVTVTVYVKNESPPSTAAS